MFDGLNCNEYEKAHRRWWLLSYLLNLDTPFSYNKSICLQFLGIDYMIESKLLRSNSIRYIGGSGIQFCPLILIMKYWHSFWSGIYPDVQYSGQRSGSPHNACVHEISHTGL